MGNQNDDDLRKELLQLKREFNQLYKKIEKLERDLGPEETAKSVPSEQKPSIAGKSGTSTSNKTSKDQSYMDTVVDQMKASEMTYRPKKLIEKRKIDKADLEKRIGGTLFNRIGIVAIVLGIAYILKYSFDNDWIGPLGRVMIGIVSGFLFLGLGEKLRVKYHNYAQGLLGGSTLIFYLSIYAAYGFYDLISPIVAFILLVIVMVNTVLMAIRHNSLAVGILGIIGGYSVPFVIGGDGTTFVLLVYFLMITAGVLSVSLYKKWSSFQYLGFVFSQVAFLAIWLSEYFAGNTRDILWLLFAYVLVSYMMFLGVATLFNIRREKRANYFDAGLIGLNALAFFLWSWAIFDYTFIKDYMGYYAIILAVFYTVLGKLAGKLAVKDKLQVYTLYAIAFVLAIIAVPLQWDGNIVGFLWLAESLAFAFMANRLQKTEIFYFGLCALLLGVLVVLNQMDSLLDSQRFLINTQSLLLLWTVIVTVLIARLTVGIRTLLPDGNLIIGMLYGLLFVEVWAVLTLENVHFFTLNENLQNMEQFALSGLWLLYGSVLMIAGIIRKNEYLRYCAIGLLAIVILKATFVDLAYLDMIFKILLTIVLGAVLLAISYIYQRGDEER